MDTLMEHNPLITYLPELMQEYEEIQQIMSAEDKQIDAVDAATATVLGEAFIDDCDEYGIKKYEKILKITPGADATPESRRAVVKLRWNSKIPYTWRALINKLNEICGVNNYDLSGDLADYIVRLSTSLEMCGQVAELETWLDKMLPENMYYEAGNTITCRAHGDIYAAGGACMATVVQCTNDAKEYMSLSGDASLAGCAANADVLVLTNDATEHNDVSGEATLAAGTVQTAIYEIKL